MSSQPIILVVDPAHFNVSYVINPWMRPGDWAADPAGHQAEARASYEALCAALRAAGALVESTPGVAGQPDMVFPANAAVVLDRRAIVARFACAERQGEEQPYLRALQGYVERGILDEVSIFPEGCFQEGAGDAIWDLTRQLFWTGYGQRSIKAATDEVERFFQRPVVRLELATPQFYHLDTCFCPLSGGEVLYYPPAFTEEALAHIHAHVAPEQRLIASAEDAAAFCVNAVCIDRTVVMARAPDHVRGMLTERGYKVADVNLDPFILSGGGAYCMTLRLDRSSGQAAQAALAAD
jgi:N-dimethylarginine dimethylaminohydrolase